ncbi:acetyltransferase [Chitinophaga polysaccharea]|nr:acetyltransferase [Chitinophaga polysaccharea]
MIPVIDNVRSADFPGIVAIWEAAVRATHDFLTEEDIQFFKPLILNEYLPAVNLRCVRNKNGDMLGFIGVAENKIEMLFVHPDAHGKGIGKALLNYAIAQQGATAVDVNEQNPQAVAFYLHMGFRVTARSATDGMGKPFPLLHMAL